MESLVSVIIPFLNEEKYIKESVESVLNQSYKNLEILLIDDYSTDHSPEICQSFKDERVRIHRKKGEPKGLANSRNLGIELARGEYIVFHDADDISHPERIRKQVQLIEKFGDNTIAGVWVEKLIEGVRKKMILPADHGEIIKGFDRTFNRVTIVAGIICFKKELLRSHSYNGNLKYFEDWDFLLRLNESGGFIFYNVPEYLYIYRIKPEGTKYRNDWIDWNLIVRENQLRRKRNISEFQNPEEMYKKLRFCPIDLFRIFLLYWLINFKKWISFEFRKIKKSTH